jgi:hypothetical protein
MENNEVVTKEAKNIDSMLINAMNTDPISKGVESVPQGEPISPDPVKSQENVVPEPAQNISPKPESEPVKEEAKPSDATIDEYGNPIIQPQKMYTEEEVQRMIRDRLSRGKQAPQQQPQQQSKPIDQPQDQAEENWQVELESFVEKTVQKREAKLREEQLRQYEQQKQAVFEEKFVSGMNKYPDFHNAIANKPITDDMMLAIRDFENPAAFLYGAAKMYPQDLDRISKLDSRSQAVEVGRLHERMVKHRLSVSKAPEPIDKVASDVVQRKSSDQIPIEARIQQYAMQKRQR